MNRLLLEIYAERPTPGNGDGEIPGLFITTRTPGRQGGPESQLPGSGSVVLRLLDHGCVLKDTAANAPPITVGLGEWLQASGWRVRVTNAPASGAGPALAGGGGGAEEANWAAPEIRINTYDGDRVKHLRCMLPVDEGSQLVVGRGGPGTDLILEDDHVSRVHMRFFIRDGQRLVEDMGSRWGTRLNGEALTSAKPLKHGDELRLGKSTVQYVCYWDMLPPSGVISVPDLGQPISNEPPGGVLAAGVADREMDSSAGDGSKRMIDSKPPAPASKAPDAKQTPVPEVEAILPKPEKPAAPPEPPAVKPPVDARKDLPRPPARKGGGFDVGWAILLILIVLAAIGYLVYLVFFSK